MTGKLRILEFTSTFPRWEGDSEPSFILDLCSHLAGHDMEIDVLAPHYAGAAKQEKINGITVYRYQYFIEKWQTLVNEGGILANLRKNPLNYFLLPFYFLSQLMALRSHLARKQYDCLHVHWIITQGLVVCILKMFTRRIDMPVLCTSHGGDLFILDKPFFNRLKRRIMQQMDQVTVVSRYMYDYCTSIGVNSDRLRICSMGVDLEHRFVPAGNRKIENELLFVGRFVEKKGVAYLLQAVSILKREHPSIRLLLVGDGPLRKDYEQQTAELGIGENVEFAGALDQDALPAVYNSSGIFVLPSIIDTSGDREGLGLVMIEAMGCGCPVVAFGHGAIHDVIEDRKTGLLAEPGNAGDLADKIGILMNDDQLGARIARAARERVLERYDWTVIAGKYHEQIRDMAEAEI